MRQIRTDVLVIGGGATGVGVLRDLALRGIRAMLVEKGDLTHGTTGRYHGLLHSGGRYVVKDQASARECAAENQILRQIMPHCLEDTGGFFVVTPVDDEAYAERFLKGCHETSVPVEEISVREALKREPLLNPRISRVFAVRDAAADSFLATRSNAEDARRHGAQVLTYHYVKSLEGKDRITGAVCEDLRTGEDVLIHADYVVNAAGAWAGKIAGLAGIKVTVVPGKGTMVAMNHRLLNTVVNRCKMPADGDIIVPIRTVAVIGTTDVSVPDPDVYGITPEEVALMLEEGEQLVPGISRARVLRAWAGVRPLYKDQDVKDDRDISRNRRRRGQARCDGALPYPHRSAAGCGAGAPLLDGPAARAGRGRRQLRRPDMRVRTGHARPGDPRDHRGRCSQRRRHTARDTPGDGAMPGRVLHVSRGRALGRGRRPASRRECGGAREIRRTTAPLLAGALEGAYGDHLGRPASPGAARRNDLPRHAWRRSAAHARRSTIARHACD